MKLKEVDFLEEVSVIESLAKDISYKNSEVVLFDNNDDNVVYTTNVLDPGYIIIDDYKTIFNLDKIGGKELYLELCEAAYSPMAEFQGENWICISFLSHKELIENGDYMGNINEYNDDSFACGAYYNKATKEIVFAHRGSERDFDDWVTNDFLGFGADDIPDQFNNTYNFFKNVISSLNDEDSPFLDSQGNKITINDINQIVFTGNSLGGGLAQLMV